MALGAAAVAAIIGEVLVEALPALVKLVVDIIEADETQAEELRKRPIAVSIAFGGDGGEALKVQATIESSLPDTPAEPDPA